MADVRIGTDHKYLLLTPEDADPIVQTVVAELSANGLHASRTIVHSYSSGFADLASFFDELARDWRGWNDVRTWRALEGDLAIEARHEYRHVQLRVTLRAYGPGWGDDGWTAAASLAIDPGEHLTQIASDLGCLAGR